VCRGLRRGVAQWRLRRVRRVLLGAAVLAASAAAVVALGLLAGAGGRAGSAPPRSAGHVVVTAAAGETVWEVAARLVPGRPGSEVAEVAERIVVENALESVRLRPGQVLHVQAR
jgi:Tfp pilus assembly protein FimV